MGRGTFEPAIAAGVTSPYAHLDQYVFPTIWRLVDHRVFDLGVVVLTYERCAGGTGSA
jgi:hypothetical protein